MNSRSSCGAYRIAPGQENNYLHGFGVRFAALDEPTRESVQELLSYTPNEAISTQRESPLDFRYGLRTSTEGRCSAAAPCQMSLRN